MAVTIKDVAREAGVSIGLVSMVINGKEGVGKETAERVLSVIKKLGYTPNRTAASLRSGRKLIIGVITPDLANHYFSEVSRQIEDIAAKNGYMVLFGSSDDNPQKMGELIETFTAYGVGGILATPCDNCEQQVASAMAKDIPVVLMNRDLPTLDGVGRVMLDNNKGMELALRHIVDSGRRHIELISNSIAISTLNRREESYQAIMHEFGLDRFSHINYVRENADDEEFAVAVKTAHDRGAEALIIPRGHLALNVFKAIRSLGLNIPEDLALLGFDGGVAYTIASPAISQIVQNTYKTAEDAFSILCEMMNGQEPRTVLLEPELKSCDSTAPVHKAGQRKELMFCGSMFEDKGGWTIDSSRMEECNSYVLTAMGNGTGVKDAKTEIHIPESGKYHAWVRCCNPGEGGIFCIRIDDYAAGNTFGGGSSEWMWQEGGSFLLEEGTHTLLVHDFRGQGACFDSVYLALEDNDGMFKEPSDDIVAMRRELLGCSDVPKEGGQFTLVVVGSSSAAVNAAVAAARCGAKVAFMQEATELAAEASLLSAERNVSLFLGFKLCAVEQEDGAVQAVTASDVESYRLLRLKTELLADCLQK